MAIWVSCFILSSARSQTNTFPSSGNVGIGTTSPSAKLDVAGDILIEDGNKLVFISEPAYYYIKGIDNGMQYSPWAVGNFTFTSGSGNWSFTNGNVGIATTSPSALLQVGTTQINQAFKVGVTGNMANSNAEIRDTLAVVGTDANTISRSGAVAWNYYNAGSSPSWAGTLLVYHGSGVTTEGYGLTPGGEGLLMFQNVSSGVVALTGLISTFRRMGRFRPRFWPMAMSVLGR